MVESEGDRAGMLKMQIFDDKLNMATVKRLVEPRVAPAQFFEADGLGMYGILSSIGHRVVNDRIYPDEYAVKHVWVHKAISLAKRFILGTYHGVSKEYLQRYLDEFCYRWNRRRHPAGVFHRLVNTAVHALPVHYSALTG